MKILPGGWTLSYVGDCAIVAECEQEISPELNSRVLKMAQGIRSRERSGIRDVVESYCGVTVYFDPLKEKYDTNHQIGLKVTLLISTIFI